MKLRIAPLLYCGTHTRCTKDILRQDARTRGADHPTVLRQRRGGHCGRTLHATGQEGASGSGQGRADGREGSRVVSLHRTGTFRRGAPACLNSRWTRRSRPVVNRDIRPRRRRADRNSRSIAPGKFNLRRHRTLCMRGPRVCVFFLVGCTSAVGYHPDCNSCEDFGQSVYCD